MPDFRSDEELEAHLRGFAAPEPAGRYDAALLAAARQRAEDLIAERREALLLLLARALEVVGLPMLSHFILWLAGRAAPLRVVLI